MKDKVSTFRLEVGKDVWSAIEEQIDGQEPTRKKRGFGWWLFPIASIMAFMFVSLTVMYLREPSEIARVKVSPEKENAVDRSQNLSVKTRTEEESNPAKKSSSPTKLIRKEQRLEAAKQRFTPVTTKLAVPSTPEELLVSIASDAVVPIVAQEDADETNSTEGIPSKEIITGLSSPESPGKKQKRQWLVLAYGGPGMSYRTLKGQNAQGIVDHRNSHEKTTLTYDAGVSGQFAFGKMSYVRFGLNYSRYAEKYEFHHDAISHQTVNSYGYGQLNVNYGRMLKRFKQSELLFLGGFGVGRLIHAQSSWVDPNNLIPVAHSNNQPNQPFENWIFNYRFTIDYQMKLGEKLRFHVFPCMEGVLNSSYKEETQLNQHPYAFNLNLGISYTL